MRAGVVGSRSRLRGFAAGVSAAAKGAALRTETKAAKPPVRIARFAC